MRERAGGIARVTCGDELLDLLENLNHRFLIARPVEQLLIQTARHRQGQAGIDPVRDPVTITVRIQRIGSQNDLVKIRDAVSVSIRIERVGSQLRLFFVRQPCIGGQEFG